MKYQLIDSSGDVVSTRDASTLEEAVELFAKIKQLSIESLLKIFDVKKAS